MSYPEPNTVKKYVYFAGGSSSGETRVQRHAQGAKSGGFAPIPCAPTPVPEIMIGKLQYTFGEQYPCDGTTYKFSFQLISGIPLPNPVWPYTTSPPLTLTGTSFVTDLGVYLPSGGGPNGGTPGASIDALDLTTGQLLNGNAQNNFVAVDDEPGGGADASLTNSGNVYGWVPTNTTASKITAFGALGLGGPNFCGWLDLLNPPANGELLPNDISFKAQKNKSYYRLACYYNPLTIPRVGPGIWPPTIIIGIDGSATFIQGIGGPPVVVTKRPAGSSEERD